MKITYDEYPLLMKIEKSDKHLSVHQPLGGFSKKGANFALKDGNLSFLINALTREAKTGHPLASHFYLDQTTIEFFEQKETLNEYINFNCINETMGGVILSTGSFQLLYLLLSKVATKELLKHDHRYIAVALFKDSLLGAYEQGFITNDELLLDSDSRLDDINVYGPGGYIGMAIAVLCRFEKMQKAIPVKPSLNKTKHDLLIITRPDN